MDYEKEIERNIDLEKHYVKINQGKFWMYFISFTSEELIQNTAVHYFKPEEDNTGYQRQLITNHYRKIAKFMESESEPIMPPAILTATDPENVLEEQGVLKILKVIRVVDGQHRIQGLRYLKQINKDAYENIANYEFPVILMVINKDQKIHEINTFINMNSKGKKVSTDLAILLRDRIREEEFKDRVAYLDDNDFEEAIATRVVKKLNESRNTIWFDTIKMAAGEDDKGKPISINAFNQSLKELIKQYVNSSSAERTFDQINIIVEDLFYLIASAWEIVVKKWKHCFNIDKPNKQNELYNIQKGIGVYPIHQILAECMIVNDYSLDDALKDFQIVLKKSHVEYTEWKIGGILSSYNSKAGFKTIALYIKNEIDLYKVINQDI
ncbi:DGQHR domain-containing protein [Peribacillus frigoritolerans]|uniref:DGQHR domain-containing protein n=1 Tax=Peribacillus frigoritolerans TaxID=450367 RepID=UPI000FD9856B|nr:DGQHR domain-containing protein [Peribacillus frigoritolerans]AZV62914.1 hypothetical protein DOZ91_21845 [Peribacillus frigoritolerans]